MPGASRDRDRGARTAAPVECDRSARAPLASAEISSPVRGSGVKRSNHLADLSASPLLPSILGGLALHDGLVLAEGFTSQALRGVGPEHVTELGPALREIRACAVECVSFVMHCALNCR